MTIKFGTDGWRAVIADEYTFDNLKRISKATALVFDSHPKISNGIVIGYDTRFLSREFAECSSSVFADHGIKVYLTDSFVTTPTVSLIARDKNMAFGVAITSSHNPAKYNGYKLKDEFGGSMGPELLGKIEKRLSDVKPEELNSDFSKFLGEKKVEYIAGKNYYVNHLKKNIDINSIRTSGLKIIYDAMFGSGQGMMDEMIQIDALRSEINPSFGTTNPEPVQQNLTIIADKLKNNGYDIGIATDGDADRIAILDENGNFIDAQKTFALLLTYLIEDKKMTGGVVRGFSSSELIKKICEKNNLKLHTVPIGFKYISELMINDDILIGAEESGGIGIKGHLPERDGIYNGLLFSEMLSNRKKKLSELISDLELNYGKFYYKRIDRHLTDNNLKHQLIEKAQTLTEVGGHQIIKFDTLDGCKMIFNDGWLLVRASGTEPLLRIYCETFEKDDTETILSDILNKFNLSK